jgi:hypothetical protein
MGFRFQRRIKILPGVRLNLSKSGIGVSVGPRGAHIGITARGQHYTSVGIPGTGLLWREYQHKPAASVMAPPVRPAPPCDLCQPGHVHVHAGVVLLCLAGLAGWVLWLLGR